MHRSHTSTLGFMAILKDSRHKRIELCSLFMDFAVLRVTFDYILQFFRQVRASYYFNILVF